LIKCLSNNYAKAVYQDFHDPIQVILSHGIKRKSPKNIDHIVYHEVGHLIADYVLNNKIGFLSIESYGNVGGLYKPTLRLMRKHDGFGTDDEDIDAPKTLSDFKKQNIIQIAGLVATEVFMGERYIGAYSDLMGIKSSYDRICANGLLSFEEFVAALPNQPNNPFVKEGPKTNVRNFSTYLEEIYDEAKKILVENQLMAEVLFVNLKVKKTLTSEEVEKIIKDI
jgi:ATP-dependent Zn protease